MKTNQTFEIRDSEIDVDGIVQTIQKNIERRYSDLSTDLVLVCDDSEKECIMKELEYINKNPGIQNNSYIISSHRPVSGKILVKGRELVHEEVERYLGKTIFRQEDLNSRVAEILLYENEKIEEIFKELNKIKKLRRCIEDISSAHNQTDALMAECVERINSLENQITHFISEYKQIKSEPIDVHSLRSEIKKEISEQFTKWLSREGRTVPHSGGFIDMDGTEHPG